MVLGLIFSIIGFMERKENDFGVVNECDDMGLGEQVILSDKKSNITMQSRLMSIPVAV